MGWMAMGENPDTTGGPGGAGESAVEVKHRGKGELLWRG